MGPRGKTGARRGPRGGDLAPRRPTSHPGVPRRSPLRPARSALEWREACGGTQAPRSVGGVWADADHPADPYPGAVPPDSYVHVAEVAYPLRDGAVEGVPLDAWLRGRGAPPLAERIPVLTYGSNRCPSKITWLRRELGLGAGPVVVLRARTNAVAAVWAAGLRARDGARPAVLAAAPDVVEEHAVWLATPEQIAVLDRCEGRDERFRLARLRTGSVTVCGVLIERPWVYLGHAAIRHPLLVNGAPVRCADVAQDAGRRARQRRWVGRRHRCRRPAS